MDNGYKKNLDRILVLQWISLLILYIGYGIGRLIDHKACFFIGAGIGLIAAIIFLANKKYNLPFCFFPFVLSISSGLIASDIFETFIVNEFSIAILLGYGLLLLVINFFCKLLKYDRILILCIGVFLLAIGIINIVDHSNPSILNLMLVVYILPILGAMVLYRKKEINSYFAYAYFISYLIFLFWALFV